MRSLVVAALALAVVASPARAAEVSVALRCSPPNEPCEIPVASYVAAPGEANALRVEHQHPFYVFFDRVPVAAGPGCTLRPDGAIVCRAYDAAADLGDGDDQADSDGDHGFVLTGGAGADTLSGEGLLRGGPGDDVLTGGTLLGDDGDDVLTGTRRIDRLEGGSGADVISGGAGGDLLSGDGYQASPAPDVIDGGPGRDLADYEHHRVPVRVDLTAPGGGGGEDTLTSIQDVVGGHGDDTLLGDARANRLSGARGRNTVVGRGGDDQLGGSGVVLGGAGDDELHGGTREDRLVGGPGADHLSGGWGRDTYSGGRGPDLLDLRSPNRSNEIARCGGGRDTVFAQGLALVARDCERAVDVLAHPRAGPDGRLTFTVPAAANPGRGRLELWRLGGRRRFAVARFDARGRTTRVTITVPRRLRGTRERIKVVLHCSDHRPGWFPVHRRWVIHLPR